MQLSAIITEADVRVPNSFDNAQKVTWLNEINQEFFDVVKIPKAAMFSTVANTANVSLTPADIRGKNITKVHVGNTIYPSFLYDDVQPGRGYFTFDDTSRTITLSPTPTAVLPGIVRYFQIGTTSFVVGTLTAEPDAPQEYHWIYILGLCERIAKAMDDVVRANNYASDYRGNLTIAQQNYLRGAGT